MTGSFNKIKTSSYCLQQLTWQLETSEVGLPPPSLRTMTDNKEMRRLIGKQNLNSCYWTIWNIFISLFLLQALAQLHWFNYSDFVPQSWIWLLALCRYMMNISSSTISHAELIALGQILDSHIKVRLPISNNWKIIQMISVFKAWQCPFSSQ